jgi:hypothetical protein
MTVLDQAVDKVVAEFEFSDEAVVKGADEFVAEMSTFLPNSLDQDR